MKKLSAKFLCVVLSLVVLLCALPVTVYADSTVKNAGTAEELASVCSEINQNGGTYTINLTGDINNGSIEIKKENAVVTVIGNNHTIFNDRTAVYVSDGAKVVLGAKDVLGGDNSTLTLQGSGTSISGTTNDNPGLIHVLPGSECEMNANVTLKDHKGENYLGSGVTVEGGTFVMNGGTIENCGIDGGSVCYGGGVAVFAGGIFTMNGGTITECYATTDHIESAPAYGNCYSGMGGGVFVTEGSAFTMNGGAITKCTATNFGGGVAMTLSDIETKTDPETGEKILDSNGKEIIDRGNPKSKAVINNGAVISENKAKYGAGVFASGLIFSFSNAIKRDLYGTGTPVNPGIYVNGGEISSNKAEEMGGGVLIIGLRNTRKAQIKNAEILNNTAANGAGVEIYGYWTETHIEGCTIAGNNATTSGGGISLDQDFENGTIPGKTYLKDTVVTNNTSGEIGAGVIYNSASNLMISGANTIQNNTYNGKLNNLNVLDKDYPVYVDGNLTGSKIGLSDPTLWNDDKEDIAADAVSTIRLTDGYKANNASLIPADAFTSDHESWVVDYGEKKTEQGAEIGRTYTYTAEKYHNVINVTDGGPIKIEKVTRQHIRLKAVTPNLVKADSLYTIKNDMLTRYNKKYKFQGNNENNHPFFYDETSQKYVTMKDYGTTMVLILVGGYDAVYSEIDWQCDCMLYAGMSHQQFAQNGEIVYQYQGISPDDKLFIDPDYEATSQTVNLVEKTPLEFNGKDTLTLFERNDLGIITDKLEVKKSSEKVDIQYDTVTTDYTNEVRLVRKKPNYHINNDEIDDNYNNNDIFTSYVETAIGKEIKVGETIGSFYTIPEVKATESNSCPYIFKGWYYDPENDNDTHPVKFGTDKYAKDIYAHWIKVEGVAKDDADEKGLPQGYAQYGGFDLAGIQISEGIRDTNFGEHKKPGGLRFVTSLNMDVVNQINSIKPNNIEYGYVAATNTDWIDYHKGAGNKLQYVSKTANGINTSDTATKKENYFDFASNINCTSKHCSSSGVVKDDHRNFGGYLLYTLVITYEDVDDAMRGTMVLARPYIHYTDANGLERVAYSEYRGNSNTIGGCYISYNNIH